MRITSVEIRACELTALAEVDKNLLRGGAPPDVVVITLHTDAGVAGTSFGFGGLKAGHTMHTYAQAAPFFVDRDPMARARNAAEFRGFDRRWNHVPIYVYGPFDNACWDIAGKVANLPVHQLLGSSRDRVPVYASSMTLADPAAYLDEAWPRSVTASTATSCIHRVTGALISSCMPPSVRRSGRTSR